MKEETNQRDPQGRKHGVWEDYREDGTLWRRYHWHHGKKHGVWEDHYPKDRTIRWKGEFQHGKEHGVHKYYNQDGKLEDIELYNNGDQIPLFIETLLSVPIIEILK